MPKTSRRTVNRPAIRTQDENGRAIVLVPLAKGRGEAVLDAADFDNLMALGVSPHWCLIDCGNGYTYVRATDSRMKDSQINIGRLIMAANPGERVRYADGNRLNLRRGNLSVRLGWAKHDTGNDVLVAFKVVPSAPQTTADAPTPRYRTRQSLTIIGG